MKQLRVVCTIAGQIVRVGKSHDLAKSCLHNIKGNVPFALERHVFCGKLEGYHRLFQGASSNRKKELWLSS